MKKLKAIVVLLLILFFGLIIFFTTPNLNPLYADGLAFWAFVLTITIPVLWLTSKAGKVSNVFQVDFKGKKINSGLFTLDRFGKIAIALVVTPWILLIIINIYSSVIFHTNTYKNQITEPQARQFTSDMQPIDVSQLPVVDYDLAKKLADKKLGEKPALGSQVTLGDPTIQKVNGKLVWVTPLLNSGFFKWLSNMGGTPGYIIISATNPRDVSYVDQYPIKYQPNAYLLDNLTRHVRLSGGSFTGLTDYSFELDDTGKPYWVVTTYKNEAGFQLPEANGVIIVDAASGVTSRYTIDNVPNWVDRVQPAGFLINQLNNRGKYVHGIFNFSNKDKYQTSEGYAIVYNNNRCYFFTGLTSVGSDESATGFVMVDMVTKKANLYQMSGATEYAAQKSAEGKVQNLRYSASFPLITNVDGEPTYFMTLKDDAGLIKQYAFVSVKDYTTVGTGETIQDALDNFRHTERDTSGASSITSESTTQSVEGTVARIASEQQSGATVYKLILNEQPGKIYMASYDISTELALTRDGDKVKISFTSSGKSVIELTAFENVSLAQK